MNRIVLSIYHNVYLTKEQRYALAEGKEVKTVGVNIPVWFHRGNTSEPAIEVFSNYSLSQTNESSSIRISNKSYEIKITNKENMWRLQEQQLIRMSIHEIELWNYMNPKKTNVYDLLDVKDGGSKYIKERMQEIHSFKKQDFKVIHDLEIKDMQDLVDSLN